MKAILLSLVITVVNCQLKPEDVAPCEVFPLARVVCEGDDITDEVLKTIGTKFGTAVVNQLTIHGTAITKLEKNTFTTGIFENIQIENNARLVSLDPEAIHHTNSLHGLTIRNNSMLSDPNVFAMSRFLEPSDSVSLQMNALKTVPTNAFVTKVPANNRLKHIYLGRNKITTIMNNAFNNLPNLVDVYVDHNLLSTIAVKGLAFAESTATHITLYLNDNQLTAKSFTNQTIVVPTIGSLAIDLENNQLTDLPEIAFKSFIQKRFNALYVYNNKFTCNCSMKWLSDRLFEEKLHGLYCIKIQKEIFDVTPKELGCL